MITAREQRPTASNDKPTAADLAFARQSVAYLVSQGYENDQIANALVQELELPPSVANDLACGATPATV